MKKRFVIRLLLASVFFLGLSVVVSSHIVSASTVPYCGVLAPANNSDGNCTAAAGGQNYTTCTVDNPDSSPTTSISSLTGSNCPTASSNTLKQRFINNINYYLGPSSQAFERVGAQYIVKQLGGSNWEARINNPQVTMQVGEFTYSKNTAYNPSTGSVIQYPDSNTQPSLIIYVKGVESFAIKLDCGNPVGTLRALPNPKVNVTIGGLIYYYNGSGSIGLSGVRISTCVIGVSAFSSGLVSGNNQVSSGGKFKFTLNSGKGFCVEVPSQFTAQNGGVYSKPKITPDYILNSSPPPGVRTSCSGNNSSYQGQIASSPSSPGGCNYGINDSGYNIAYTKYVPRVPPKHKLPPPPRIGAPCPLPPWMSSGGTSTISLPYNSLQPSGTHKSPPSPSYTTSPGSVHIQAVPYEWEITSAHDQYGKTIGWKAKGYQKSTNFTLIYTNYIKNYPYDKHVTTVNYNEKYKETKYVSASSPSFYKCGSKYNGHSKICVTYTKVCSYWRFKPKPGRCTKYTTKKSTYPATPYYYYSIRSRKIVTKNGIYQVPQVLNEICPRNFDISDKSTINRITLSGGTIDTPTSATVASKVQIKYSYLFGGSLIKPMSVHGLTYEMFYYIAPAASTPNILNLIGTYSGQLSTPGSEASNGGILTNTINTPTFNFNNISVGDKVCAQLTIQPEQQEIDYNGDIEIEGNHDGFSTNAEYGHDEFSGRAEVPVYSTSSSYEDLGNPDSASNIFTSKLGCSLPVTNYPYTRIYGNDITNGVKFNGTILPNPLNSLLGNEGTSIGAKATGSGSQFAAMAIGQITNFATAFLRNLAPQSPNGLSYANNSGTFGGNFTSSRSVVYNYYARKPRALVPIPSSSSGSYDVSNSLPNTPILINVNDGIRTNSSYVRLVGNGRSSIHVRGQHIIYVNGNVYINNNVHYTGTPHLNSSTGTISNVPSLYVIALGNIYIGPNVSHLAGIYIAENQCDIPALSASLNCSSYNASNGGLINTCSDVNNNLTPSWHFHSNNFNSPSGKSLFTQCDTQLVVTGSLIADQVNLERTYASIRNSSSGENPFNGGPYSCSQGNPSSSMAPSNNSAYGCSAQVFDFNPINYLANPDFNSNQNENYDYIVSLPPVL